MDEGFESEDYRAWDKMKQEKRSSNREQSAAILTRGGVVFESKNNGAHLIVQTLNCAENPVFTGEKAFYV